MSKAHNPGGPLSKFGKANKAGATDTEVTKTSNAAISTSKLGRGNKIQPPAGAKDKDMVAHGGKNRDVAPGQAAETKTKGHVGPADVGGRGGWFGLGGPPNNKTGKSSVGEAGPAVAGITGNPHAEANKRKRPDGV
jgi:hypothetical protein